MQKKFKVMICPLNWGIGHATRCVPLVRMFLEEGFKVILGADGRPAQFLKEAFPDLDLIPFPGFRILYPESGSMALKMVLQSPGIIKGIINEHHELKRIIHQHKIDLVISDNRFGLWSKSVPCVYMTHQVMIKAPRTLSGLESLLCRIHGKIIRQYTYCWIPDLPGSENLSGDLSHYMPVQPNCKYIGPLSRFMNLKAVSKDSLDEKYRSDLLFLISGPEPQRTIFEKKVADQLRISSWKSVILRGLPGEIAVPDTLLNTTYHNHLDDQEIAKYIYGTRLVIARPGYSTIMDMAALGSRALFVPTPGQTEQEYLAKYLKERGYFDYISQSLMDLSKIQPDNYTYRPPAGIFDLSLPRQQITKIKNQLWSRSI